MSCYMLRQLWCLSPPPKRGIRKRGSDQGITWRERFSHLKETDFPDPHFRIPLLGEGRWVCFDQIGFPCVRLSLRLVFCLTRRSLFGPYIMSVRVALPSRQARHSPGCWHPTARPSLGPGSRPRGWGRACGQTWSGRNILPLQPILWNIYIYIYRERERECSSELV